MVRLTESYLILQTPTIKDSTGLTIDFYEDGGGGELLGIIFETKILTRMS